MVPNFCAGSSSARILAAPEQTILEYRTVVVFLASYRALFSSEARHNQHFLAWQVENVCRTTGESFKDSRDEMRCWGVT